jgi:uncharacterized protein
MLEWLKKRLPSIDEIKHHRSLRIFGKFIHSPNLWHMNERSVARAFACGLFVAFLPIPFQMVVAAALAMLCLANVFIAVILVWVSNPITIPPIFYFCYRVGRYILNVPPHKFKIELSYHWLHTTFFTIWKPLVVGSLVCGVIAGLLGYISVKIFYRYFHR